jgi:hypothetical protein
MSRQTGAATAGAASDVRPDGQRDDAGEHSRYAFEPGAALSVAPDGVGIDGTCIVYLPLGLPAEDE